MNYEGNEHQRIMVILTIKRAKMQQIAERDFDINLLFD